MQLDVVVDLLDKTKSTLTNYRDAGFAAAQSSAKELSETMNVEAVLKEKSLWETHR